MNQPMAWPLPHACAQPYHAGSDSYRLKQGTHIHQPTAKVKSAFAAHENLDVINMTYLKTNCFGFASKSAQKLNLKVKFYKIRQRLCRSGGACSLATVFQANTMNEKTSKQ